jgi:hypothetical protein
MANMVGQAAAKFASTFLTLAVIACLIGGSSVYSIGTVKAAQSTILIIVFARLDCQVHNQDSSSRNSQASYPLGDYSTKQKARMLTIGCRDIRGKRFLSDGHQSHPAAILLACLRHSPIVVVLCLS